MQGNVRICCEARDDNGDGGTYTAPPTTAGVFPATYGLRNTIDTPASRALAGVFMGVDGGCGRSRATGTAKRPVGAWAMAGVMGAPLWRGGEAAEDVAGRADLRLDRRFFSIEASRSNAFASGMASGAAAGGMGGRRNSGGDAEDAASGENVGTTTFRGVNV